MNSKKLAWILAGSSAVAGAVLGLAACSGDDTKPLPVKDGGVDSTTGDSGKDTSTDSTTPDATPDGGGCFSKLRPAPDAGPFCYFIPKANDAGNGINCATGETCCYGAPKAGDAGFDPSVCVGGSAAACPAPTNDAATPPNSFECAEKNDCTNNQVCCIVPFTTSDGGTSTLTTGVDKFTCTIAKGEQGTRCKATCGAGDLVGCQSDSECGGKKCVQIDIGTGDRLQMGYCN